ncbi:MAG: septal ring lytic transglycosylase RlpA family protein [Desulfobacterales bacterium]
MISRIDRPCARLKRLAAAASVVLVLAAGCAPAVQRETGVPPAPEAVPTATQPKPYRVDGQWYQPIPDASGFQQRGTASWYGEPFHGRRTSSGEIYDMYGLTAAHKTLPMGTMVRVRNLQNGQNLDVRINDRGPFVHGRVIDLSYGAARKLGVVGPGTAPVEIAAIAAPAQAVAAAGGQARFAPVDLYTGNFTFQVGAFREQANALRLQRKLSSRYPNVHIASFDRGDGLYHRVRVGLARSLTEAERFESQLIGQGFDVFIVAE